jgi:diguanylate cyclase (GGDEF)-like protein
MNGSVPVAAVRLDLRRRLRRPAGIAESTRWLLAVLAIASLAIGLPAPLSSGRGTSVLLALAAAATVTCGCVYIYVRRRVPLGLDLLDAVAITGFSLACTDPTLVFGYVFAAIWFRALYGSTWRSLARCGLYAGAVASTLPLWTLMPGHTATPAAGSVIGVFPIMFVTVVVARQLGGGLVAREQCLRRDAALATTGSRLLGVTDEATVRAIAWTALEEICAATPGLRVLKAVRHGGILRVEGATGGFGTVPASLPGEVIAARTGSADAQITAAGITDAHIADARIADTRIADARIADGRPLDAAVGVPLGWLCVSLTELGRDSWLFMGAPTKVPPEAVVAVRNLVNQTALALRSSDVHQKLTAQARVDSLTGLANRASFTAELSTLLHRRGPAALHVLFLDLDDFKNVNDVLGHRAGDELLIEVGARLRGCIRPDDLCARLGGDEFAVVLRGATDADATEIAQRVVDSVAEPVHLGGGAAQVGASIGIAAGTPGIGIEELVHRADVAMYAAKAHGKGRVQLFDSGLLRADTSRLSFERELATATAGGELVVHYQPVLSLPDLRCTAVEALVRWQHPQRGLLHPRDFIEAAERTGAIVDIGAFVLRRACADAAAWQRECPGFPLAVHVNVSSSQLDHDNFIGVVKQCLAEYLLPASQLVLELTETVVLNSPAAIGRLQILAAHGVQIAIDDFGTGYSSMTTLRSLPVNVIKLDASFVAGALANPIDRTVIEAIVQMSTQLGLHTIAEGVERPEQQKFLEDVGTDAVQGFLYLAAVPAPQLAPWLRGNLGIKPATGSNVVALRPTRRTA